MASPKNDDIFYLLGIPIANVTKKRALEMIWTSMEGPSVSEMHFANAHCINVAAKHASYLSVLQQAKAVFADGTGIRKAGAKLNHPIVDNVNGTDLFPMICSECAKTDKKLYLLGGKPGVAEKCAQWANTYAHREIIAGFHDGFFSEEQTSGVLDAINASKADLLLVAMGVPRQELWLHDNLANLTVPVVMGVGGLFDFYSGTIRRSPVWMRKLGIEWVWRLMMEPKRMWRRYIIGNIEFLLRIGKIRREQRKGRAQV
jgi:N-acetylglucosaminyldiphosphoundecaprenol N-acetyl-beta-D-mannosaminyltransferase